MNAGNQPDLPPGWVSDKEDLDEIFKDTKPYGGGDEFAIPGFFESDEEQQEFVDWVRAERNRGFPGGATQGAAPVEVEAS